MPEDRWIRGCRGEMCSDLFGGEIGLFFFKIMGICSSPISLVHLIMSSIHLMPSHAQGPLDPYAWLVKRLQAASWCLACEHASVVTWFGNDTEKISFPLPDTAQTETYLFFQNPINRYQLPAGSQNAMWVCRNVMFTTHIFDGWFIPPIFEW